MSHCVAAFPEEDNECMVEDCTAWLIDIRAAIAHNHTSCPVPEDQLCEKFAAEKSSHLKTVPDADWSADSHVTVKNIMRVVDTQNWQNCVIVYDLTVCKLIFLFHLFISLSRDLLIIFSSFFFFFLFFPSLFGLFVCFLVSCSRYRNL